MFFKDQRLIIQAKADSFGERSLWSVLLLLTGALHVVGYNISSRQGHISIADVFADICSAGER